MIDFITDFGNYLKTHYPIHPLWADLLSATTLASVLTEDTFFRNNFGRNRCNLWIAYLAPSGDFKSVPIDECVIPLLRYLTSWYAKNTGQPRYFILPSIASSVEGMIKHLAEFNSRGLIYRDELTTLFKESLHKDYLTDEFELYSKFYDGIIPPRETMKFNLREPLEVYVNLVGATTPQHLYHNLSLQFFFQGCGNRWLYVRHQVPKRAYQEEELFVRDPPNWTKEELPTDLMKFADALIEASKTVVEFTIDPEAEKISTHFFNEREELRFELMKSTNPFIAEYVRRDWQKSLKLAQLRCLSRNLFNEHFKELKMMMIEPEDVEWGQEIVRKCFEHFNKIVGEWAATPLNESRQSRRPCRQGCGGTSP